MNSLNLENIGKKKNNEQKEFFIISFLYDSQCILSYFSNFNIKTSTLFSKVLIKKYRTIKEVAVTI